MDLRYVLAFYVLLLAFLVWVCVLADPQSESLGGKLNFYLTEKIPDYLGSLLQKVLPARVYGAIHNGYDYVANQRNPLLQGLYLLLLLGSLAIYITQGWRRMSEADILISCGLSVICLLTFSLASTVPPGFVTIETIGRHRQYECDDVLYTQGRICNTCNTEKVARSKHCRLCGGCIARFDHHCGWLNQCVGEENYRHFLAFLAIHVVTFAYGCTRIVKVFLEEVAEKRLLTATFYNAQTGKPVKSTPLVVVQYFIAHEGALVGVLALAAVMAVVIAGFLGYHLLLVARNVTTNETFKWQEVRRKTKSEREALQRAKEISGGLFEEEGPPNPKNLYDRGLLGNVWEVLHPRSRRQDFSMDDEEYDPFEAVDEDDERAGSDVVRSTQARQQHCPKVFRQEHEEGAMQSDMDVSSEEGVEQHEPALLHSPARGDDMNDAGGGLNADNDGLADTADDMYWGNSRDKEVMHRSNIPDSAAYEIEDGGPLANDLSKDNTDQRDKASSRGREHRTKRPRSRGLDKLGTMRPRSDDRRHRHGKPTQVRGVDRETSHIPRKRSDRVQKRRRERSDRRVPPPTLSNLDGDSGNDHHERSPIPLPNELEQECHIQATNGTASPPEGVECDGQVEGQGSDGLLPEQNAKVKVSLSREQKQFLAKAKKVVDKVLMKYYEKKRIGTKEDFERLSRRLSFKILSKEHGNTKVTAETPKKIVKYVHAWFRKFGTYEAAKMSIQTDQSTA